jgi:GMP synthase-like glutamine amidotransferase
MRCDPASKRRAAADRSFRTGEMERTPRPARLWIIDPSLHHPEDQGVAEILGGWSGSSHLFQPGLEPGDGPRPGSGYDCDGVILLGSAASVYDAQHAWLPRLSAWIRPLLNGERRIPLLGICFGHQLIAQLARGRVDFVDADRSKVLGVEQTRLEGGRLLPGEHALRVVVSHREEVKQAPPDYRITARRDRSRIDGLEHRTLPVFSFQFHPEAREEFVRRAGLAPSLIDDRLREDSRRLLAAFLARVRAG